MERGKRESFSIQILQLVDAVLIGASFWLVTILRGPIRGFVSQGSLKESDVGLVDLTWVLFIIVPFLPIILEIFGFYKNPLRKRLRESMVQLLQAIAIVALVVGFLVIFWKVSVASRWIWGQECRLQWFCCYFGKRLLVISFFIR